MKRLLTFVVTFLTILPVAPMAAMAKDSSKLRVIVNDIRPDSGKIYIGVYGSQNTRVGGAIIPADSSYVEYTFDDIVDGDLRISLFHDSNNNQKLDFENGMPSEGVGMDSAQRYSIPVTLAKDDIELKLSLIYLK